MRTAFLLAFLALAGVASAQQGEDVVWTMLDVAPRLDADGRFTVVETHEISLQGDFNTLGSDFGLGTGQSVSVKAFTELGADGAEHPYAAGDPKSAGHYAAYPTWIEWHVKAEGTPPLARTTRRYRLEYELVHAVAPAWDLPNGAHPLDGLHPSYGSPLERLRDAWSVWREAGAGLTRAYRLDHDVLYPSREKVYASLQNLGYQLTWDPKVWELVGPEVPMGTATRSVDFRVRRTFRRLVDAPPSAVDVEGARRRLAAILILPFGVVLLAFISMLFDALRGADQKPLGPELFESAVLSEPAELVQARVAGRRVSRVGFSELLERLAVERKLQVRIDTPATEETPPGVTLRLLVPRDSLHPYEQEVVDALFAGQAEISTAQVQARRQFDPESLVSAAFARVVPKRPAKSYLATGIAGVLAASGFALTVTDLQRVGAEPYAPVAAAVGALVARLGLPPAVFWVTLAGVLAQLVPNVPIVGLGAVGVSLVMLSGYQGTRSNRPTTTQPEGRRLLELQRIRDWAAKELRKPRPALRDAWIPHLHALGLGPAVAKWRERHGGASASVAPDLAEVQAGAALSGPPFTGERPPSGVPDDDEWAAGFYVETD